MAPLLGLLTAFATACAADAPQDALKPAGEYARKADQLWDITFAIAVAVFVVVEGVLVYTIIKFRNKDDGRKAEQFHGNTRLEVVLTIIPSLILAGLAVPTVKTIFDISNRPKGEVLEITVIARQFWWEFHYDEEKIVTANELHIPAGKNVHLDLRGADVNHSFWIPRLAGTQDAIPGRVNSMYLQADRPGRYIGQCKEFCGLSHANMRQIVFAHTQEDYDQWVREQKQGVPAPANPDDRKAAQLFMDKGCAGCHAIEGLEGAERIEGKIGPDLTHYGSRTTFGGAVFRNTPEELSRWLRDPPAMKPGVDMPNLGLTDEEISSLVAYLLKLK